MLHPNWRFKFHKSRASSIITSRQSNDSFRSIDIYRPICKITIRQEPSAFLVHLFLLSMLARWNTLIILHKCVFQELESVCFMTLGNGLGLSCMSLLAHLHRCTGSPALSFQFEWFTADCVLYVQWNIFSPNAQNSRGTAFTVKWPKSSII